MNYSAIRVEDDLLRRRSTTLFGGYGKAVEAAGFNYEKCRVDTDMASYYGIVFEELVKEIFDKLRIAYGEPNDTRYRPDIIMRYKRWVDVKLSEWTIDSNDCDTIEKYLPHCRQLTIIYLRGRSGERMYNGNVRLINAREYVKQLPRKDRGYFYAEFNEIEAKVNGIETKVS